MARLVDLLVIKQGDRIAHQKGWKRLRGGLRPPSPSEGAATAATSPRKGLRGKGLRGQSPRAKQRPRRPRPAAGPEQPLLFEL
jgi:hypothetical protein